MAGSIFPTTRWSLVLAVGKEDEEARTALANLCTAYWVPLYSYVRRRGFNPDEAQDLTQGFFLDLLARKDLRRVRPEAGRFRSFLCASAKHFISNEMDRARALKRGGGTVTVSFDAQEAEKGYRMEPADAHDPETVFERRWVATILTRVEEKLSEEFCRAGRADEFRKLRPVVAGTGPRENYAEIATGLGISEDALKMRVHRLRRRFGLLVREEIADTVVDPSEIEDELRHLLDVVRN